MITSQKGIELNKYFESCKLTSYLCPAGVWTIGYGHTRTARSGMTITRFQAEQLLKEDLLIVETQINKLDLNLNQNQFDALVSFTFNLGIGNLKKSKLLQLIKLDPNDFLIAFEFPKWRKANGVVLKGLERRRKIEAQLYFTGHANESS